MKVRFEAEGREYRFIRGNEATLTQLIILKRKSGLSLAQIEAGAHKIQEIIASGLDGEELAVAVFSDEEALLSFAASVWLTRWLAGDGLDFEEANDFRLAELEFIQEPGDVVPEAEDPQTAPSDGEAPVAEAPTDRA